MKGEQGSPTENVVIGERTSFKGPLFWSALVLVGLGGFQLRGLFDHRDGSKEEMTAVKADVATKAEASKVEALAVEVAAKADVADLKELAAKVVTKDVFDAVTDDFKNRFAAMASTNDRLASELADARREAQESSRRLEDLIRDLPKHP